MNRHRAFVSHSLEASTVQRFLVDADFLLYSVAELAVALCLYDDGVGVIVRESHKVNLTSFPTLDVDEVFDDLGDVVARRLDERVVVSR